MHDSMMSQIGMEQDHRSEYERTVNTDGWAQIENYSHQTQQPPPLLNGYDSFQYIQATSHGLPIEPAFTRMPPLPPATSSHSSQPQLLPLLMPSHHPTWPSMLTNPSGYQAPVAIPPASAPLKGSKLLSPQSTTPRKTLTDQDRRRMCQYHEQHPNTKQIEIGAMFGVERSTVSKVLRQKEKYLFPEDRALSPVKRQKGKFPDIDRALSSWVRNSQKQGIPLSDALIKEKALLFAITVGSPESNAKANSASWLEKFKQKNGIGSGKLLRRASETNVSESSSYSLDSSHTSASGTPGNVSPTSPVDELASPVSPPLPSSKSQEDLKAEGLDSFLEFHNGQDYRHSNSDSSTSSFSSEQTNPSTPYHFSTETSCAPFMTSQQSRRSCSSSTAFQRPRSQTFPALGIDPSYISPPETSEPLTPKFHHSATAPSTALDLTLEDSIPSHFGSLDSAITSPELHHRGSRGSLLQENTLSPTSHSVPNSPTSDEARAAIDTLLNYAGAQQYNSNAYMTVVELTKQLGLQNNDLTQELGKDQTFVHAPKMEYTMSAGC